MKKLLLAFFLIASPYLHAAETNSDRSALPVDEKSFIEAISEREPRGFVCVN